jgi:hypothetical protein
MPEATTRRIASSIGIWPLPFASSSQPKLFNLANSAARNFRRSAAESD